MVSIPKTEQIKSHREVPLKDVAVYSDDMTIADLMSICRDAGVDVVATIKRDEIFRGEWDNTRDLINQVCFAYGMSPRFVDDSIVLVDSTDALEYVRWASGRPEDEAKSIVSGLGLAKSFVVDASGLVFIGVPLSERATLEEVLRGLDSGDDWLVQVSIVDASGFSGGDVAFSDSEFGGGWTVQGNDLVETFMVTLQAGAERNQSFGSQVPFRTNVVTENGLFLDGNVEYQEIKSVIRVEVVEGATAPKVRIGVESRRPGSQSDGLFEIVEEEIESEFFVRPEPVLVGSLRRWDSQTGGSVRWPLSLLERSVRRRQYNVFCHAVRLGRPSAEL